MSQTLFINATIACLDSESGYGLREHGALLVDADKVAWVGAMQDQSAASDAEVFDCAGRLLTPGLTPP